MGKSRKRNNNSSKRQRKKSAAEEEDSIEAQLDRQRRKRAQTSNKPPPPPERLGGGAFVYDAKRKAYFPKGTIHSEAEVPVNNRREDVRIRPQRLLEVCATPGKSRNLRAEWIGRVLSSAMIIEPTMQQLSKRNDWAFLLAPVEGDFHCKSYLHASAKTFDVMQTNPDMLPYIATMMDRGSRDESVAHIRCAIKPPQNVSGWRVRLPTCTKLVGSEHPHSCISFIRNEARAPALCLLPLTNEPIGQLTLCRNLDPNRIDHSDTGEVAMVTPHCSIFDFAVHPTLGVEQIAVAPRIRRSTGLATMFATMRDSFIESRLMPGDTVNLAPNQFLSRSDSLCVQYISDNGILHGRRNGSITLFDGRASPVQLVAKANEERGSVTSIVPLGGDHLFLAKRSFGSCQFYDIRNMSTNGRANGAMVFDMQPPPDSCSPTLSSCCSGVALDPSQSIVISPFTDNKRKSHFALWSLVNGGKLIGTKAVGPDNASPPRGLLPFCELRSEITSAWTFDEQREGKHGVKRRKNAWSLWFKSREVQPTGPLYVGTIHQLTFPG